MPDGVFDFAMGYPAENNGATPFPCGATAFDTACFGIYRFDNDGISDTQVAQIGKRFQWDNNDATLKAARDNGWAKNWTPNTSTLKPDLEWSILSYNDLLAVEGVPPVDVTGVQEVNDANCLCLCVIGVSPLIRCSDFLVSNSIGGVLRLVSR
jgi:hypothetical protein